MATTSTGSDPDDQGLAPVVGRVRAPVCKTIAISPAILSSRRTRWYLNPPEQAAVLCMDEKSQIQALDRTQRSLPMKPGHPQLFLNQNTSRLSCVTDASDLAPSHAKSDPTRRQGPPLATVSTR